MLSLLKDLSTEGYGRLVLDVFALSISERRVSSGIVAAILYDDDEVRLMRSLDERSRIRSGSASSSLDPDERVLRDLVLLWRSRSLLRSRSSLSLLRRCSR